MLLKIILIIFSYFVFNCEIKGQKQKCSITQLRILNNFYTMATLQTFHGKILSAVSFARGDYINYVLDNKLYQFDPINKDTKLIQGPLINSDGKLIMASGKTELILRYTSNDEKVATLDVNSDDKFVLSMEDNLILVIRLPMDEPNITYGRMYAMNKSDATIIGQFVATEWVKELGERVTDVAIDRLTGDIIVAVDNKNGGELVYLQKNINDQCEDSICEEPTLLKNALREKLRDMEENLMKSFLDSLNKNQTDSYEERVKESEDQILELSIANGQLRKSLTRLQNLDKDFREESFSSVHASSLNVTIRSKRSTTDEEKRFFCAPNNVYLEQKSIIAEAIDISNRMDLVLNNLRNKTQKHRVYIDVRAEPNQEDTNRRNNVKKT